MSDIERKILQALQTATIDARNASIVSTLPIKMIGRTFEIPDDNRYLEVIHIPNNSLNSYWGNEKTYRGLFRLILHWGIDDEGAYAAMNAIGSISSFFTKDKLFEKDGISVRIYEKPDLTSVIEQPPELLYPVTIRYISFQTS